MFKSTEENNETTERTVWHIFKLTTSILSINTAVCVIYNSFIFFFPDTELTRLLCGVGEIPGPIQPPGAKEEHSGIIEIMNWWSGHQGLIKRDVGHSGQWGFVDNSQGDLGSVKITQDKWVTQGLQRISALTQNFSSSREVSQPTVMYWEQEHSEQDRETDV